MGATLHRYATARS